MAFCVITANEEGQVIVRHFHHGMREPLTGNPAAIKTRRDEDGSIHMEGSGIDIYAMFYLITQDPSPPQRHFPEIASGIVEAFHETSHEVMAGKCLLSVKENAAGTSNVTLETLEGKF
jgi:hypothetical protein